ncbi:MAG: AIR synthase family protein [Bacillota bacterium]
MQIGKLSSDRLKDTVLSKITRYRDDVLVNSDIGEDSAVLDFGDRILAISSDPITGAGKKAGYLAVHVACNDIVATGAVPIGIQVVLLLPENITDKEIKSIMTEIDNTSKEINVQILGGHTEILSQVNQPIIIVTAIGSAGKNDFVATGEAKLGDEIIITKGLGLEGAFILANDYTDYLLDSGVSKNTIKEAKSYDKYLSVLKEGVKATEIGVNSMHDITEGGLIGALDEVSRASNLGFKININIKAIPDAVQEITEKIGIDPYSLISSGSLLITTKKANELIDDLSEIGIKSFKIGEMIKQGKIIDNGKETKNIDWDGKDSLWKFIEQNKKNA